MAFAQIYVCSEHGETWHPEQVEEIDTQNDEVYHWMRCPVMDCHREVTPLMQDGKLVFHALTGEELFWESCEHDSEE